MLTSFALSTAVGKLLNFLFDGLVKLVSRLPASPFDYSDYVTAVNGILQPLNYFVPFYLFSQIFAVWEVSFTAVFGIFLLFRWISRRR